MTTLATIVGGVVVGLALATPEPEPEAPEAPAPDPVAAPSGPPDADTRAQARTLAQQGEAAFIAGRYDEAGDAYRRAHALDAVPLYLFAWARSEQEAGRCREAIDLYQRFIATRPPALDVDRANLEVGRCYGELSRAEPEPASASAPAPASEPQPQPAPAAAPAPADARPPRAPWLRDPWGGVMLATGVTALSVGTGLYLQALADDRRAAKAGTTDEFRTASQRALTLSGAGIAGFTVGSALVVGAVVRYVVVARRRPRSTTAASPFVLRVRF